ncbi:MAG: hypothetical protein Q8Q33_02385 [Chlamydiota bacterium]|nr:hypothetical protein [Chlamydiota bacterium]
MIPLKNIEKLSSSIQKTITDFSQELILLYGPNLKSIVIYGNAADNSSVFNNTIINTLLLFETITVKTLQSGLRLIEKGRKKGLVAPLFLTTLHIKSSQDTFPMEFLEMKEIHLVIYGDDPFDQITIKNDNLRLQCEQQIKGTIIKLRQSYLEIGLKKKGLESLLRESFQNIPPIFRTILRIYHENIPKDNPALITSVCKKAAIQDAPFLALYHDMTGSDKITQIEAVPFFERYLKELFALAQFVDTISLL